jgi:ribosome-associated toxin RatA of RatAB toxin-antitoxin module
VREYRFLTAWLVSAQLESVYEAIDDVSGYPDWWSGVERVDELEAGDADGVGSVHRQVWKSLLPYHLEFTTRTTRVERPHVIEADATGELVGHGRWRLFEAAGATAALYEWNVSTSAAWMNLLAPIAKPVFAWNHHYVMRRGGEGLARRVAAQLLAAT